MSKDKSILRQLCNLDIPIAIKFSFIWPRSPILDIALLLSTLLNSQKLHREKDRMVLM